MPADVLGEISSVQTYRRICGKRFPQSADDRLGLEGDCLSVYLGIQQLSASRLHFLNFPARSKRMPLSFAMAVKALMTGPTSQTAPMSQGHMRPTSSTSLWMWTNLASLG